MKDKFVPQPPPAFVVPQSEIHDRATYIEFLQKISPRVKVIASEDLKMSTFKEMETGFKNLLGCSDNHEEIYIRNWPKQKEELAMIVSLNSSMTKKATYLVEHTFLFFYGDWAFSLDPNTFEQEGFTTNQPAVFVYSLEPIYGRYDYDWKNAVRLIKNCLEYIEEKAAKYIPRLPKEA
jgi:hypothetical protein